MRRAAGLLILLLGLMLPGRAQGTADFSFAGRTMHLEGVRLTLKSGRLDIAGENCARSDVAGPAIYLTLIVPPEVKKLEQLAGLRLSLEPGSPAPLHNELIPDSGATRLKLERVTATVSPDALEIRLKGTGRLNGEAVTFTGTIHRR